MSSANVVKVFALCAVYMAVGPLLMVLNKEIFDKVGFKYPMLVASMGPSFAFAVTHSMKQLGYLKLKHEGTIDRTFWLTKCLPVGVCHAVTLAMGNALYLFMGMSMIQFLKAFTPIVVAVTTFFMLGRKETPASVVALFVVCGGTCASIADVQSETGLSVSPTGLLISVGDSLMEAFRLVMIDKLLSGMSMDVFENLYWLSPAGSMCLTFGGLVLEGPKIMAAGDLGKVLQFPVYFMGAASMGLVVQLMTTYVIKATSATSLKVLGLVRNIIPVLCGVLLYNEHISTSQGIGYSLSFLAFGWYSYMKMQKAPAQPVQEPAAQGREDEMEPLQAFSIDEEEEKNTDGKSY